MGIIYKFTSPSGKSYIGQTHKDFEERKHNHILGSQKLQKNPNCKEGCIVFWRAIIKYGIKNFSEEILIVCANDRKSTPKDEDTELDCYEKQFIKQYNCLSPNGYNQTSGGNSNKILSDDLKEKISQKTREAMKLLGIKIKQTEESKDFPMYLIRYKFRDHDGYAIIKHPKCKHKEFNIATYGTLENAYSECIKELEKLNTTDYVPKKYKKKGGDLPSGLFERNSGYVVQKIINKRKYKRNFASLNLTKDQNLALALEYLLFIDNDPLNKELPKINGITLFRGFIAETYVNGKRISYSSIDKTKTREENYNNCHLWLTQIKK